MCLSTVYLGDVSSAQVVMEEVARITSEGDVVEVQTIFGEKKFFEGYKIKEVDLTRNYILLEQGEKE